MSLFERLNNKRYDLQERKKKISSSSSSGNNKSNENISTGRRRIRKAISDLEATQPGGETPIETGRTTYNKNKNINQDISQRRTAQDRQQQLFNRQYDAYDDGDMGNPNQSKAQTSTKTKPTVKTTTSTNTVKQSKVSDDASEFTKRVNRANKNRKEFIKGRKTYTDSKTGIEPGKPTKEGIKKYIAKARDMRQGTNANQAKNKAAAEVIAKSSGKQYSDKITKKYETDKRMIKTRKPRKTISQLKKDIELQDIQKTKNYQAGTKKRKATNQRKIEKKFSDKITQKVKLKQMRPQRKLYKRLVNIGQSTTKAFGGPKAKLPPVAKKFARAVAAAPAPVKVASVAALPLLSPTVRKTVKNVALAGLGAAGFAVAKKKPPKPESFDIGINLSSGKGSSEPSKYALKRQELLKNNPKKVPNKNLA